MPRYVTPSPSPPPARRRKRSASSGSSSMPSASASVKQESLVKTSLVFLGSIVAATFCAHKFWPKGVTYGGKEAWEVEEVTTRIRRDLADEKRGARRRRRPVSMAEEGGRYRDERADGGMGRAERDRPPERDGGRRHTSRDGRRRSYYAADKGAETTFASSSSGSRGGRERRGSSRERERERDDAYYGRRDGDRYSDRYSDRGRDADEPVVVHRRPSRRDAYYPPAPQRPSIAAEGYRSRPQSVESYRSRPPSVEGRRSKPYYAEVEPEYVYAAAPRARRASVDGGRARSTHSRDEYT